MRILRRMPYYFAYGSNLNARQMAERCPGAVPLAPARLDDFRLAFTRPSRRWGGHAADILEASGQGVWGICWLVTGEHLQGLDRFEGVAAGAYRRLAVPIHVDGHGRLEAVAYAVVEPGPGGLPSALYLETILEGAIEHDLPAHWIDHLRTYAA